MNHEIPLMYHLRRLNLPVFSKLVYNRSCRNWHSNIIIMKVMTSQISNWRAQKRRELNGGPRIGHPNIIMLKVIKFDVGMFNPQIYILHMIFATVRKGHQQNKKIKILACRSKKKRLQVLPSRCWLWWDQVFIRLVPGQILEKKRTNSNCKQDIFYILHAFRLTLWVLYNLYD